MVILFIVLALTSGGSGFRWFGDTVRDVSHDIGEVADLFNQATQDIKSATETIRQTGEKLKDIAEDTEEKASGIINTTSETASGIANTTGEMVGEITNTVSAIAPDVEEKPESKSERKRKRTATKNAKDK